MIIHLLVVDYMYVYRPWQKQNGKSKMMIKVILTLFYSTGNEELGWVMETQLRNQKWSYWFSTEIRKLKQSFNDNTPCPILFFLSRSFVSLEVNLHVFRRLLKQGKEQSKRGPYEDLIKLRKHLSYNYLRYNRLH